MRSDEDLLSAARGGDGEAFAVFYRRHVSAITAFIGAESGPRNWPSI